MRWVCLTSKRLLLSLVLGLLMMLKLLLRSLLRLGRGASPTVQGRAISWSKGRNTVSGSLSVSSLTILMATNRRAIHSSC